MTNADTRTLTLGDFLLARIAEREAEIQDALGWLNLTSGHKTARLLVKVLAEYEAHRRIIASQPYHSLDEATADGDSERWYETAWVLGILAAVYADHRDYRPEWRL